jgi:hypothetical protein
VNRTDRSAVGRAAILVAPLVLAIAACTSPSAGASSSPEMMDHSAAPSDMMMDHSAAPSDMMMEHSPSPAP